MQVTDLVHAFLSAFHCHLQFAACSNWLENRVFHRLLDSQSRDLFRLFRRLKLSNGSLKYGPSKTLIIAFLFNKLTGASQFASLAGNEGALGNPPAKIRRPFPEHPQSQVPSSNLVGRLGGGAGSFMDHPCSSQLPNSTTSPPHLAQYQLGSWGLGPGGVSDGPCWRPRRWDV